MSTHHFKTPDPVSGITKLTSELTLITGKPGPKTKEALEVPELLEGILVCLPMADLFVNQRVCKKWKDVISTSKPIRRVMFLEPESTEQFRGKETTDADAEGIKINPLIGRFMRLPEIRGDSGGFKFNFQKFRYDVRPSSESDKSWYHMFVTQPPVLDIELRFWKCGVLYKGAGHIFAGCDLDREEQCVLGDQGACVADLLWAMDQEPFVDMDLYAVALSIPDRFKFGGLGEAEKIRELQMERIEKRLEQMSLKIHLANQKDGQACGEACPWHEDD